MVLRALYKETSLLLMGDAQPETEEYLLKRRYALQSTLLKVSEHGAAASSTLPFLVGARPLAGIISVGPGESRSGRRRGRASAAAAGRGEGVPRTISTASRRGDDGKRFTVATERLPAGEATATKWSFPLAAPEAPVATAAKDRPGNVLHLDDVEGDAASEEGEEGGARGRRRGQGRKAGAQAGAAVGRRRADRGAGGEEGREVLPLRRLPRGAEDPPRPDGGLHLARRGDAEVQAGAGLSALTFGHTAPP